MEIIGYIIIFLFMIIGLISVIQGLILRLLTPKAGGRLLMVLPMERDGGDAEWLLRSAQIRAKMMGGKYCLKIVAVDCGMDDETKKICDMVCRDLDGVSVCGLDEVPRVIKN